MLNQPEMFLIYKWNLLESRNFRLGSKQQNSPKWLSWFKNFSWIKLLFPSVYNMNFVKKSVLATFDDIAHFNSVKFYYWLYFPFFILVVLHFNAFGKVFPKSSCQKRFSKQYLRALKLTKTIFWSKTSCEFCF